MLLKLFTIFHSQIHFLQSEYSTQVVKSTFDEETRRLFRSFQNNTNVFSDSSLSNMKLATELSAMTELTSIKIELHPAAEVRKLSRETDTNLGLDPASCTTTSAPSISAPHTTVQLFPAVTLRQSKLLT